MSFSVTRRWLFVAPILLYVVALFALRIHLLSTDDAVPLVVALVFGGLAVGLGVRLVLTHRVTAQRLSSR